MVNYPAFSVCLTLRGISAGNLLESQSYEKEVDALTAQSPLDLVLFPF